MLPKIVAFALSDFMRPKLVIKPAFGSNRRLST